MKFLDHTQPYPTEAELHLDAIKSIYFEATGRSMVFEDPKLTLLYNRFRLERHPLPIGFILVANETIPPNTLLFPYGGEQLVNTTPLNDESEYTLDHEGISQNGQNTIDFGCLLVHLTTPQRLEDTLGIDRTTTREFQGPNTKSILIKNRIYHATTEVILPGTVLGFDYGIHYWMGRHASPLPFLRSSAVPSSFNNALLQNSIAVFYDKETGKKRVFNSEAFRHQLAGIDILYPLRHYLKYPDTPIFILTLQLTLIIAYDDFKAVYERSTTPVEETGSSARQLSQLFMFFPTTQRKTCALPPGFDVDRETNQSIRLAN